MIQIWLFRETSTSDQDGVTDDGFTIPLVNKKLDRIYKMVVFNTGHEAMEDSDP